MTSRRRASLCVEAPSTPARTRRPRSLTVALATLALLAAAGLQIALPAAASAGKVAVFGDVNNSASGDTPAPVFGFVCSAIAASGATAVLSSGDALNDIADSSESVARGRWSKYLAVERQLSAKLPVWRVAGDNDRLDVAARLDAWNATFPGLPTAADAQRRWYSKNLAGMHVVFLNTAYAGHMGWMGFVAPGSTQDSAQGDWLVKDLKAYTAAHRGKSTIVVVTHYSPVRGKVDKPYAGAQKAEATALQALYARYGVDMVVCGDTHVYRRTMVTVRKAGKTYRVPYIQIPPAASTPRTFGASPIPALSGSEAGWAPGTSYRGFITIALNAKTRKLTLAVRKVAVSGGAVSAAGDRKANGNALGGVFVDVPVGAKR